MMSYNRNTWETTSWLSEKPDSDDFSAGFNSHDGSIRENWAAVTIEGFFPTAKQISKGLSDEECEVRYNWARRSDYTPTTEQVTSALMDSTCMVCESMAFRNDITPTEEQIRYQFSSLESTSICLLMLNNNMVISNEFADEVFDTFHTNEERNPEDSAGHDMVLFCLASKPGLQLKESQYIYILSLLKDTKFMNIECHGHDIYTEHLEREFIAKLASASEFCTKSIGKPRL